MSTPTALSSNRRTGVGGWIKKARAELTSIYHIVGLYPTTLLWPLLVLGLVLAIGVWGVTHVAQSEENSSRDRAANLALDAAIWVQQQLTSAIAPVMLSAAMINYNPQIQAVGPLFKGLAPVMLAQAPDNTIRVLQLVPNGVVSGTYPWAGNEAAAGLDVFASETNREGALKAVRDRTMTLAGPMNFVQGGYGVVVRKPIFIQGVTENETFGIEAKLNPICGEPCAFNATTRAKFWGFISALVELGGLAQTNRSRLKSLGAMGYLYELEAPSAVGNSSRVVAASPKRPKDPVEAVVLLPNNQWVLRVSPEDGWSSKWYGGLLAGVVILAIAMALLLFFALISWRRHQMLLEALLPKQLIQELRGEEATSLYKCRCPNIQMAGETPADLLLDMMGDLLEGHSPDLSHVVFIRTALLRNLDLYTPLHVRDHIKESNLDAEVAQALMQQLVEGRRESILGGPQYRISAHADDKQSSCTYDFDTISGALAFVLSSDAQIPAFLTPAAAAAAAAAVAGSGADATASGTQDGGIPVITSAASVADRSEAGLTQSIPLMIHRFPHRLNVGGAAAVRPNPSVAGCVSSATLDSQTPIPTAPVASSAVGEEDERYGIPSWRLKTTCRGRLFAVGSSAYAATGGAGGGAASTATDVDGNSLGGGDAGSADGCDDAGAAIGTSNRRFLTALAHGSAFGSSVAEAAGEGFKSCTSVATVSGTCGGGNATAATPTATGGTIAQKLSAVARMLRGRDGAVPEHRSSTGGGSGGGALSPVASANAVALSSGGGGGGNASTAATVVGRLTGRLALALPYKQRRAESSNGCGIGANGGGCGSAPLPIIVGASCLSQQDATVSVGLGPASRTITVVIPETITAEADAETETETDVAAAAAQPRPAPVLLEEVERLLSCADHWHFDLWALQAASGGHALSVMGYYLIHRQGLISRFRLKPVVLARLLRQIEAGYIDNPYHNATHAADVLQMLHVLLYASQLHVHYLDPLGLLAAYFAAIIHDYGHPGFTGDFLVATSDTLALRYNDRSPLENHHCAAVFVLMNQRPELGLLAPLSAAERRSFRKLVIDMVLATDMKQHFSILSHFNTVHRLAAYQKPQPSPSASSGQSKTAPIAGSGGSRVHTEPSDLQVVMVGAPLVRGGGGAGGDSGGGGDGSGGGAPDAVAVFASTAPRPVDETERVLGLQMALKCADIGNLGRELECYKRWVDVLEEEFFRQGDRERELGLPISPLSDRTKQGVSKSQTGFFDFVALPLVHAMASAFPGAQPLMRNFLANYNYWASEAANAAVAPATPPPAAPATQTVAVSSSSGGASGAGAGSTAQQS